MNVYVALLVLCAEVVGATSSEGCLVDRRMFARL